MQRIWMKYNDLELGIWCQFCPSGWPSGIGSRLGQNSLWVWFLAVSDIYPMFIELTITWVPSGFSGYIWLEQKLCLKKLLWGRFWVPNEANKNSMNLCRLILTHMITSNHNELSKWTGWGWRMWNDPEWIMNDIENMILMMINRPDQSS